MQVLRKGARSGASGGVQKFARTARLGAVPRRVCVCVILGADYPKRAMYAECGAGRKTVDGRRIRLQEMVRAYMYLPGFATIGGRRENAPSVVAVGASLLNET